MLLYCGIANAQYDFENINYLGRFDDPSVGSEPVYGIRYQSCWGWVHPTDGREYGIMGSTAGTYIIDVTDPVNPVERDYVPHYQTDLIWHEYKTFGNYLYIISDDAGINTLQIADLSYLPDSVHVVYDGSNIFKQGHTLYIEGNKMYVGSVTRSNGTFSSMAVYSLNNPVTPQLLRNLNSDYSNIQHVHDMYVKNDTVYANCGYQGLFIFRYDSTANRFFQLGAMTSYIDQGYNHSSFLSEDRSTLYVCEEVPDGKSVKIVDVSTISNPNVVDTFYSNRGCTPHNPYVKGDYLYIAYYMDGVYIYDITTPTSPVRVGYFDTYPDNAPNSYPGPAYKGCWAVYTDLPSGVLLASDMQRGLFCLAPSLSNIESGKLATTRVYPNPATDRLIVDLPYSPKNGRAVLTDVSGRILFTAALGQYTVLETGKLSAGICFLRIETEDGSVSRKVIIQ